MFVSPHQSKVVSAARSLVKRQGYAAVSLRQIAAEAGYSPAGLYAHFPGLHSIFEALADDIRQRLAMALEQAVTEDDEPLAQLVAIGFAYIAFAAQHPAEFELLFRYTRSRKKSGTDPLPSSFDLLRTIARRGAPQATDDQINVACLGLWSTVHGLAALRQHHLAAVEGDWEHWSRQILQAQAERLLCFEPQ